MDGIESCAFYLMSIAVYGAIHISLALLGIRDID